jgi:hypothetical protein
VTRLPSFGFITRQKGGVFFRFSIRGQKLKSRRWVKTCGIISVGYRLCSDHEPTGGKSARGNDAADKAMPPAKRASQVLGKCEE